MAAVILFLGICIAISLVVGSFKIPGSAPKVAAGVLGLLVMIGAAGLSSVRVVGEDEVGVIIKNFGSELPPGKIIATNGEKGPQAKILGPGWHFWYFPGLYEIQMVDVVEVGPDQVGLLTATDGRPLPTGAAFAPEWETESFDRMLDAEHFLGAGNGYSGPQATVLTPKKYRINPKLFKIDLVPATNIEKATVAVVKSNVGEEPTSATRAENARDGKVALVDKGHRGIWREAYLPNKLYLNTKAYELTMISTRSHVLRFAGAAEDDETRRDRPRGTSEAIEVELEERAIGVRTSDGFEFPVDVRVVYHIKPEDAPVVVASLGDDRANLQAVLNSAVRAIFRNNAERVKALDYVQQRSQQESQSLELLAEEMKKVGVTIDAVRIGDIGRDGDGQFANLLSTQTDREIALQEQETFREQQRAAEQRKELTRTEQEAEEEKRLATAKYEVSIAEEDKQRAIIAAGAEAEAIRIKAEAQAEAFRVVAEQIGSGNAALVELLKIVGDNQITITPRVMVVGNGEGANRSGGDETTALIGTMLDSMLQRGYEPVRSSDDRDGVPAALPASARSGDSSGRAGARPAGN